MRFMSLRIGVGVGVSYMVLGTVARPILRKVTGWDDYEKQDTNDRHIEEFLKSHEGKKVIELKEGENYF